jgi:hypothetical protein
MNPDLIWIDLARWRGEKALSGFPLRDEASARRLKRRVKQRLGTLDLSTTNDRLLAAFALTVGVWARFDHNLDRYLPEQLIKDLQALARDAELPGDPQQAAGAVVEDYLQNVAQIRHRAYFDDDTGLTYRPEGMGLFDFTTGPWLQWIEHRTAVHTCKYCDRPFYPTRATQQLCSNSCASMLSRKSK